MPGIKYRERFAERKLCLKLRKQGACASDLGELRKQGACARDLLAKASVPRGTMDKERQTQRLEKPLAL